MIHHLVSRSTELRPSEADGEPRTLPTAAFLHHQLLPSLQRQLTALSEALSTSSRQRVGRLPNAKWRRSGRGPSLPLPHGPLLQGLRSPEHLLRLGPKIRTLLDVRLHVPRPDLHPPGREGAPPHEEPSQEVLHGVDSERDHGFYLRHPAQGNEGWVKRPFDRPGLSPEHS